jgi:predicted Zn-dependent protease
MKTGILNKFVLSLALLATLVSLAFAAELSFKPGWNLFSPKQDLQVGGENSAQVDKELPMLKDAEVERYVNELGRRLAEYTPNNRRDYAWQFKVVNSPDINAFALPGGFIYVNRATIEAAQDEAQLAGVIAHEEGHVVMRHGTHQASQMMLAQAPLAILGGMLGESGGLTAQLAQAGIGLGVNSIFLHNSRGMESQADEVGTYVLYRAGYDPRAMAQFFEIIEKKYPQGGGPVAEFFANHPNPGNRVKNVEAEISQLGPARPGKTDSPEFQAVKKRVLALPPPPKVHRASRQQNASCPSRA